MALVFAACAKDRGDQGNVGNGGRGFLRTVRSTGDPPSGKPGDNTRGGFWYDASQPETPLRYLLVWVQIPRENALLQAKAYALPLGLANN